MGFTVRPDTLDRFAGLVERNGIALSTANVHLAGESRIDNTDGLWLRHLLDAHGQTVDRMTSSLAQGFHMMGASADELARTARHYRTVDQGSAADLDATYPGAPRPPIGAPAPVITQRPGVHGPVHVLAGGDVEDPLRHLGPPPVPAGFTDPMALFNFAADLVSPTWWINQVLNDTIGVNPLDVINQHLIGDWKGFARAGEVWGQLALTTDAIEANTANGLRWLAADWQGRAGDAAVHYFDRTCQSLRSHGDVFRVLHDKYREIARDLWLCAKTLADLVKAIMDYVLITGAIVLSGAALSWTGIGAGVSWALAAWECARIVNLWGDAVAVIGHAQTLVTMFVGFATSPDATSLGEITPLPMPAVDYDHPGVGAEPARPRQKGE